MNKPKLLWLSDSPLTTTGFAGQTHFLLNNLVERGWEVHLVAHNYVGQRLLPGGFNMADGTTSKYFLYGAGREPYARDVVKHLIKTLRPEIFGVLLDTFMLMDSGWYIRQDFSPAKLAFWFPSDGGNGMPVSCEALLARLQLPVAMARYGQKQVKDYYGINTDYIPHAVDHTKYIRFSDEKREQLKKAWGLSGKFVFGSVYRNQQRKFADRMFKAFARFSRGKDDVVLLCHTDPNDVASYFNTMKMIQRLKLENKVVFTGMNFYDTFTYEKMLEVYNLIDCFTLSTSGEGFGVPIIEAMSCEIPVVMPSYTTGDELVRHHNSGYVAKLIESEDVDFFEMNAVEYDNTVGLMGSLPGGWDVDRGFVSIKDLADKYELIYSDKEKARELGKNGRKAVLENYTWQVVSDKWHKALSRLLE